MTTQFPIDYHIKRYSPLLKEHRLRPNEITKLLERRGGVDDAIIADDAIKDDIAQELKDLVRYIACPSLNTIVPVSIHPYMDKKLPDLEYLFRASTSGPRPVLQTRDQPSEEEYEMLRNHISSGKGPVLVRNVRSRYPPGIFNIPSTRMEALSARFYRRFSPLTPIRVHDTLHPDFPNRRVAFDCTLDVMVSCMYDPYASLHTIDSAGIPTAGMTPFWISRITGVAALLQENPQFPTVPADIGQLQEHLSIYRPLSFSGLLVDPHGMCHFDILESGVRYVFFLPKSDHLTEQRLEECIRDGGTREMEYAKSRSLLDDNASSKVSAWNVVRLVAGDVIFFPPGTMRFYYSPNPSFTTSGSFICQPLLDRTVLYYNRNFHVYPRHLRAFRQIVICLGCSIARNARVNMTPLDAERLVGFLDLFKEMINIRNLSEEELKYTAFDVDDMEEVLTDIQALVGSVLLG